MANPGIRPLTRAQHMENRAFLRALRRTGNVREAARAVGFPRGRFIIRRAKHPAFAQAWDAALALAHAALAPTRTARKVARPGEPYIARLKNGRLQVRPALPGTIDRAAKQRFLAALAATCNVALSAAAAGFTPSAFQRHRKADPAFAREWQLALAMGYERLELALLASTKPENFTHDDWRRNDPLPIPPLTANQALQLLHLHQKEVRLDGTPDPLRRRRGESAAARDERLTQMGEHRATRNRLAFRIAEAERLARGEKTYFDWEVEGNPLPDLSQVTGWSKAKGKPATDASRALFGGWRLNDIPLDKRRKR